MQNASTFARAVRCQTSERDQCGQGSYTDDLPQLLQVVCNPGNYADIFTPPWDISIVDHGHIY